MPHRHITGSIFVSGLTVLALLGIGAGYWVYARHDPQPEVGATLVVTIMPGSFTYRDAGDFSRDSKPANAPLRQLSLNKPLTVMSSQVSEADYQLCVQAGACAPLARRNEARSDYPVTGTSWDDATDYARWLSDKTGRRWRLPSDEEWAYFAGSKFKDDALDLADDADFSQRWLARYDFEAAQKLQATQGSRPKGSFGANEHGLLDLSGNVWEWTDTCFKRQKLDDEGKPADEPFLICGVRVAEGRHRAYVSDFIRDARGGGCAVGIPPDNLGFRLVRD